MQRSAFPLETASTLAQWTRLVSTRLFLLQQHRAAHCAALSSPPFTDAPWLPCALQWLFFVSILLFLLARLHNVMVYRGPGALDMHVRLGLLPFSAAEMLVYRGPGALDMHVRLGLLLSFPTATDCHLQPEGPRFWHPRFAWFWHPPAACIAALQVHGACVQSTSLQ